jgi:hypothetical protein
VSSLSLNLNHSEERKVLREEGKKFGGEKGGENFIFLSMKNDLDG